MDKHTSCSGITCEYWKLKMQKTFIIFFEGLRFERSKETTIV